MLHVRAQGVLRSLDDAKRQRLNNERMRESLLDAEDLQQQLHEQLFTRKFHADITAAAQKAAGLLAAYEAGLSYSDTTRRHDAARYMADCQLQVGVSELVAEDRHGRHRAIVFGAAEFAAVRARLVEAGVAGAVLPATPKAAGSATAAAADSTTTHSDAAASASVIGASSGALAAVNAGAAALERAARVVESGGVDADCWLPALEPPLGLLRDVAHHRDVLAPLAEASAAAARLRAVHDSLQDEQRAAVEDGNVAASEALADRRVTVLEGMGDVVTHKFRVLDAEEAAQFAPFHARLATVEADATALVARLRAAVLTRKRALDADLARLRSESDKAAADEALAHTAFAQQLGHSDAALQQNNHEQAECWEQLHALEGRLAALAAARRQEVDRRVKMVEREERRRVDMAHFTDFVAQHAAQLRTTLHACEADDTVGALVSDAVAAAVTASRERLAEVSRGIAAMRAQAAQEHLSHFRQQYLLLGDLLFKAERRLDELDKHAGLATMRQHLAMESLNPAARTFAANRRETEEAKAAVLQRIDALKAKASLYVEAFKPTERLLAAAGKGFVHPVQELLQINKSKGSSLAAFHALMVSTGGTAVHAAQLSPQELEEERRSVELQREQVQEAMRKKDASMAAAARAHPVRKTVPPRTIAMKNYPPPVLD